jgi:hypothetical protein
MKAKPFEGNILFNPYNNIDSSKWRKANFQVQSYAWIGITSGRGNTNTAIYNVYKSLGYDIIATSDYQKINTYRNNEPEYIPVYEHGYGIKKNHQVLIGSRKVLWTDYPFFQTIHNKQNIINKLRKNNELIYIAHPKLRNGYDTGDLKWLANYDGIEVLNNYRLSIEHWDSALSSGNYVTLLGNDDAHDISNPDEIGHHCTFINSATLTRRDIVQALKSGKAFGARIYRTNGESFKDKIKRTKILPIINSITVSGDTITIKTDSIAREIRFVGQNGIIRKTESNTNLAIYKFNETDTYIRTEIEFYSRNVYFLNPVCRSENGVPSRIPNPEINVYRTFVLRIIGFATIFFIVLNYFYLKRKFRRKSC